jgi:hypothetical protein
MEIIAMPGPVRTPRGKSEELKALELVLQALKDHGEILNDLHERMLEIEDRLREM